MQIKLHRSPSTFGSWSPHQNHCVRITVVVVLVTCVCYLLISFQILLMSRDLTQEAHHDHTKDKTSLFHISAQTEIQNHDADTNADAVTKTSTASASAEPASPAPGHVQQQPAEVVKAPILTPFIPQPLPYSPTSPPCTTYARKDGDCHHYPSLRSDPLPSCGGISSSSPDVFPFLIIGDWAHGGHCQDSVASLAQKIESQFGRAHFVWGLGDTAYWDATCQDLNYAFPPGQYFSTWLGQSAHEIAARAQCRTPQSQGDQVPKPTHDDVRSNARYYPVMGNHDWDHWYRKSIDFDSMPYFQYFRHLRSKFIHFHSSSSAFSRLFLNGQAVKDRRGIAHVSPGIQIVALNSNLRPSHIHPGDAHSHAIYEQQLQWLKQTVDSISLNPSSTPEPSSISSSIPTASASGSVQPASPFKLVGFHHPPFASAQHDAPAVWMDLEYEEMGFDAVFFGHQHAYERLIRNSANKPSGNHPTIPYFLNGLGGHPWVYDIDSCKPFPGSKVRYNKFHGIQLGLYHLDQQDNTWKIQLCLYTLEDGGSVKDHVTLKTAQK